MAGRYEKVFSLPENLYAAGSPVIIAAGALQKDTRTGKIFAQLKLQSISSGIIKAAAIQISLFDVASRLLSNQVEYQYLDVEIIYGQTFGEKILIPVEYNTARSFSVAVTEVIFADQRICGSLSDPWEPLPPPISLNQVIEDPELLHQYRLKFNRNSRVTLYQFTESKDLWRCSCGSWNHENDEKCLNCQLAYSALATFDWNELKSEKAARIEQEIAEKAQVEKERTKQWPEEEATRTTKKKKFNIAIISTLFVIISGAIGILAFNFLTPQNGTEDISSLEQSPLNEQHSLDSNLKNSPTDSAIGTWQLSAIASIDGDNMLLANPRLGISGSLSLDETSFQLYVKMDSQVFDWTGVWVFSTIDNSKRFYDAILSNGLSCAFVVENNQLAFTVSDKRVENAASFVFIFEKN